MEQLKPKSKRKPKEPITLEDIRNSIEYDPVKGSLVWKDNVPRGKLIGDSAVTVGPNGSRALYIKGHTLAPNRIAYFLHTGEWPVNKVFSLSLDPHDLKWNSLLTEKVVDRRTLKPRKDPFTISLKGFLQ